VDALHAVAGDLLVEIYGLEPDRARGDEPLDRAA
jgi:hypothetical protein